MWSREARRASWLQTIAAWTDGVPTRLLVLNVLQFGLALGEYLYALSLRSIALRAHALVVASGFLQTASTVVSAMVRDKRADGHFSFGYGRCPVLLEYAGATILILVTCSLSLEAALRLKHHSALFRGHDRHSAVVDTIITHDVSLPFVVFATAHAALVFASARLAPPSFSGLVNNLPSSALHAGYRDSLIRGCGGILGLRSVQIPGFSRRNFVSSISVIASICLAGGGVVLHWSGSVAIDACSCAILCVGVFPMLVHQILSTAPMLLQRAPAGPLAAFDKGVREVATLEGVVECMHEHFWEHRDMLTKIRARFAGVCTHLTVQIETHEADSTRLKDSQHLLSHSMQLLRSPARAGMHE